MIHDENNTVDLEVFGHLGPKFWERHLKVNLKTFNENTQKIRGYLSVSKISMSLGRLVDDFSVVNICLSKY